MRGRVHNSMHGQGIKRLIQYIFSKINLASSILHNKKKNNTIKNIKNFLKISLAAKKKLRKLIYNFKSH